ncbi:MAG: DUF4435 domain-containing protein [Stenotrophomonas nitritireducens]|uniref:DUF4435 domain-containing protein n=1 Tax=Stenotrophomonas nitritireducens TaxID=83617 RepID=UPI001AD5AE43|nr:DUF4435 domain-containing protein [Stenotrophomonas nitritireducens]MBN8791453.1 DUF4435 domain-containing protein [Stenotrophomonas nitritireducens]MBN8795392.1 DUF4435 domain-containing protein [Stenotrophomonas nitritireducens]
MIERSEASKYAKHVFFSAFNDVDIFIEDTAVEAKKIYVELIGRALGGGIKLSQVFPIGSKEKVLKRCAADQGGRPRKAVYIVDGDFDCFCEIPFPNIKRLYRLERYSVENYLFDEDAVVRVLDEEIVDRDEAQIRRDLDFNGWMAGISQAVRRLTIACAVGKFHGCCVPVVNYPIQDICSTECGAVDEVKVGEKIESIKSSVDSIRGDGEFSRRFEISDSNFPVGDGVSWVIRFAPGKTVLLPLLKRRLRSSFGFSHKDTSFRLRLAKRADVSGLSNIAKYLN